MEIRQHNGRLLTARHHTVNAPLKSRASERTGAPFSIANAVSIPYPQNTALDFAGGPAIHRSRTHWGPDL